MSLEFFEKLNRKYNFRWNKIGVIEYDGDIELYGTNEKQVFDGKKFKILTNKNEQEKILEKTEEIFGCTYTYELNEWGGFFIIISFTTLAKAIDKLYIQ